ncbi:CLN3 protein-domain-containing protein [Schizophyllum amplum]|uniref:Protein BTN n=1 Tax=Schizophyllum amplum TaxID=97359 RepID=A0A550CSB4_9AGAR|nr:CLN3 protein-domain-containing protein [Auriculariopsis ampla]
MASLLRHTLAFFVFGLINNVLYVIILSAALDLLTVTPDDPSLALAAADDAPPPAGIIAFCNIFPALVAKLAWPYLLPPPVRYARRVVACCAISACGMLSIAFSGGLAMRLAGIGMASFSCGLGELTFLQLSTTYPDKEVMARCVGAFSSGTGFAGLFGAFLWWSVRGLGVRTGVGGSSVLPLLMLLCYFMILPSSLDNVGSTPNEYTPIATDDDAPPRRFGMNRRSTSEVSLTLKDKYQLVRPLLARYMIPLFLVYFFEYTINQGVSPTLSYPPPSIVEHPILGRLFRSRGDFYVVWQMTYQTTVFFSRSSLLLSIPALPERLLPLPATVQGVLLAVLVYISVNTGSVGLDVMSSGGDAVGIIYLILALIALEGICGGSSYVNTFYRINQESDRLIEAANLQNREVDAGPIALPEDSNAEDSESDDGAPPSPTMTLDSATRAWRDDLDSHPTASSASSLVDQRLRAAQREFLIGSLGFSDSVGILLASIISVPVEVALCKWREGGCVRA